MRNKSIFHNRGKLPVLQLFFCGFLVGILIPNMIWKLDWHQKTIASMYLLSLSAEGQISGKEYFFLVLRRRGSYFVLTSLCGVSVFGVPIAVAAMVLSGLWIGLLLTMSILQFGIIGAVAGAALLFPQYLLYLPAQCYLMEHVYAQSLELWRAHGLFPGTVLPYAGRVLLSGLAILTGIFLETFCNPWILEVFWKNFQLF